MNLPACAALAVQEIALRHGLTICEDRAASLVPELLSRTQRERACAGRRPGANQTTHAAAMLGGGLLSYSHSSDHADWTWADIRAAVPFATIERDAKRAAVAITGHANGGCVTFKGRYRRKGPLPPRCDNRIKSFSDQSRLRLLKLVNSFDRTIVDSRRCVFITLTYPSTYPTLSSIWKRQLDNFRRSLTKCYGRCGIVWKLEPQERGAPHFHLLVFFPAGVDVEGLRRNVVRWWCGIVDHVEREKHERVTGRRQSVEVVRHFGGVCAYAAKYVGKSGENGVFTSVHGEVLTPGRFWGCYHRDLMLGDKKGEASDEATLNQCRRVLRKYAEKRGANLRNKSGWLGVGAPSFTAFLPECDVQRVFDAYMPWRRLNASYVDWRSFEIDARRELYVRSLVSELLPTDEGHSSADVAGLWN